MDLSIIIVSWNVKDKLRDNLKSIYQSQGDFNLEVFVVDNNSQDDTVNMVKKTFSKVRVIANKKNLGFAKACNQGLKEAQGKYLLLLNPDMRLELGTLNNFLTWFRNNPQASIASCKLVDQRGKLVKHVRRFPHFSDQLSIVLKLPHFLPGVLNKYLIKSFDYSKSAKVDSVRGAFFGMSRDKFDSLIQLDERYFLWFEEIDFCRQAKKNNQEVWYTPKATCVDYIGQSFSQIKSLKTQKYFSNSMLKYFKKWHPRWQYNILLVAWQPMFILAWLKDRINFKTKSRT